MITVGDGEMRVVLGEHATSVERKAAGLLSEEVRRRTGLVLAGPDDGETQYALTIGMASSGTALGAYSRAHAEAAQLAPDGFHIATMPDASGGMFLIGESPSGVVAGVGEFLRRLRYREGAIEIPALTMTDAPRLPVRGIYFATHFNNFYHVAPLEEIDSVIEDFALWGGNQLVVWFDMHHFESFDSPAAREHLARLQHLSDTARSLAVKFGLACIANEGYDSSPERLRADPRTGTAHYQRELCPSKPEGLALIGKWQAEVLDAFPEVDFIWSWPYDQGGCACGDCAPWGANGFLRASEQLSGLYRERFPDGDFWLSTWLLDQVNARGELDGLLSYMSGTAPDWFDGIVVGTHGDWIPEPLLSRPSPARYPLAAFPEISMYGMHPWGGHGANPLPGFCARLADNLRGNIVGGWPYSEGIYEDLNKFYWARFYWDPDVSADDVLEEYAAYYLASDVAGDAVRLFGLMEGTHQRSDWSVANLDGADEEWELAQAIDSRLPQWARESWRWRILYIRAAIDGVLEAQGASTPDARARLGELCDELVRIYHAEDSFIRPPDLPALPPAPDPANLAFGRPVSVSSCLPGHEHRPSQLVDGILSQHDGENFWCHDRAVEETPQVTIELEREAPVKEVRLQFRGLHGVFWFVPESVQVLVSTDGEVFHEALAAGGAPIEGNLYTTDWWAYEIDSDARYVRLVLGRSQHIGDEWEGAIELTEIEVR